MGADTFTTRATGKTAGEAFRFAVEDARHEHGHGGYSGTLAEKHEFVLIKDALPPVEKPMVEAKRKLQEMKAKIVGLKQSRDKEACLKERSLQRKSQKLQEKINGINAELRQLLAKTHSGEIETCERDLGYLQKDIERLKAQPDVANKKPTAEQAAFDLAHKMIQASDPRIDDKWGPAGCIQYGPTEFLFFGWSCS